MADPDPHQNVTDPQYWFYETDFFPGCGRFYQKQSGQLFATEISELPSSLHSTGRQADCSVLRQEESEASK